MAHTQGTFLTQDLTQDTSGVNPAHWAARVLNWFDRHGRHDLPWQVQHPYPVWVSEIMLQQTQVSTARAYFERFMQRFPTVTALAQAPWDEVAAAWAGLGYYARARNLHRAAQQVVAAGGFPDTLAGWMALPGIGRSTAGAILALGQGRHGVIMDGNVRRVLCRFFAIADDPLKPATARLLWAHATALTPTGRTADYTQAMMDLGATVCTPRKPLCLFCPLAADCRAHQLGRELDFPVKKVRKPLPVRNARALVVQHDGRWLWEQRPATGIWGGLLCLPLMDAADPLLPEGRLGACIEHTMTHVHWVLQLLYCEGDALHWPDRLAPDRGALVWLSRVEAKARGLPVAMLRLLEAHGDA